MSEFENIVKMNVADEEIESHIIFTHRAAIAQAVEEERERLFSKIASMDYKSIKGEKWLLIVRNDALAILEANK